MTFLLKHEAAFEELPFTLQFEKIASLAVHDFRDLYEENPHS